MKKLILLALCCFAATPFYAQMLSNTVTTGYVQKWNAVSGNAFVALQIDGTDKGYIEWGTNAARNGAGTEMSIANVQGKISLWDNTGGGITVSSGNLGIGTASPGHKLHVMGTSYFSGLSTSTVAYGNVQNWNSVDGNAYIGLQKNGVDKAYIEWGANTARNGAGTEMFINNMQGKLNLFDHTAGGITVSNGNIGVGTTSPGEKLTVVGNISANGNIITKKIKVSQSGWSDYVFDETYALRDLYSVEKYIRQNKHLPEVPSAKEVEAKGIDLGDTQALLLKKIEELTLYVIELKKENDSQKRRITQLEQKIK